MWKHKYSCKVKNIVENNSALLFNWFLFPFHPMVWIRKFCIEELHDRLSLFKLVCSLVHFKQVR